MSVLPRLETLEDLTIVVEVEVEEVVEVRRLSRAEAGVGSGLPEETAEGSGRGEDLRLHRGSRELRAIPGSPAITGEVGEAFTWTDSVRGLREAREASEAEGDSEDITITKTLTAAEDHLTGAVEAVEAGITTGDPGATLGVEAELAGNCEE